MEWCLFLVPLVLLVCSLGLRYSSVVEVDIPEKLLPSGGVRRAYSEIEGLAASLKQHPNSRIFRVFTGRSYSPQGEIQIEYDRRTLILRIKAWTTGTCYYCVYQGVTDTLIHKVAKAIRGPRGVNAYDLLGPFERVDETGDC